MISKVSSFHSRLIRWVGHSNYFDIFWRWTYLPPTTLFQHLKSQTVENIILGIRMYFGIMQYIFNTKIAIVQRKIDFCTNSPTWDDSQKPKFYAVQTARERSIFYYYDARYHQTSGIMRIFTNRKYARALGL